MRKIIREIKHRLRSHNPKRIFCCHRYNIFWSEGTKDWAYMYYICEKCGKNMVIQTFRQIEKQRNN